MSSFKASDAKRNKGGNGEMFTYSESSLFIEYHGDHQGQLRRSKRLLVAFTVQRNTNAVRADGNFSTCTNMVLSQ